MSFSEISDDLKIPESRISVTATCIIHTFCCWSVGINLFLPQKISALPMDGTHLVTNTSWLK